jgi:hypothetical protein
MSTTPVASPEAPAGMGSFARLVGVFLNPKATLTDIAQRPGWIVPVVVLTVIWLALNIVLVRRVNWVEVSKQQIEKNKFAARQIEQLTPEQRERAYERAAERGKVTRYVRGVIGWPLAIVILGGIYHGLFKLFGGARISSFKVSLSVLAYAYLPSGLRELIAIPVSLFKDPSAIDPENFLASNVAAFMGGDTPLWQLVPTAWLDVFGLWSLVLVAIGYSVIDPKKVSLGKSFAIVFGLSIALILVFTGLASLFS